MPASVVTVIHLDLRLTLWHVGFLNLKWLHPILLKIIEFHVQEGVGTLSNNVTMEQEIPRQRNMFNLKPFLAEIWMTPPEGNSATLHPLGSFPDPMFLCLSSSLWGCHQQDQPTGWWVSAFCTHTYTHTHPHMSTEVNTLTYTISLAEIHIKTVLPHHRHPRHTGVWLI